MCSKAMFEWKIPNRKSMKGCIHGNTFSVLELKPDKQTYRRKDKHTKKLNVIL